jgi:hypothetical protein
MWRCQKVSPLKANISKIGIRALNIDAICVLNSAICGLSIVASIVAGRGSPSASKGKAT